MNEAYEYVDCPACEGKGGADANLCGVCRGDGVVIRKLVDHIKRDPERVRQTMKRIERMFSKP